MLTHPRRALAAVAVLIGAGTAASATALHAADVSPDGTTLRADLVGGGEAHLELEDRNAEPAICFVWDHDAPNDGDSIESRVLTRAGALVMSLGVGDQWVDGSSSGCEIPRDDRYRDVFADPGDYVVEFAVVENQGTPRTSPVRSGPLQPESSG